ncbi:MAG: hypothetical protein AAGF12_17275 [Myxococcota bacterium]
MMKPILTTVVALIPAISLAAVLTAFSAVCPVSFPATVSAQSSAECAPTIEVDKFRFLRQVTLDMLGRIPTYEEYDALRNAEDPAAFIDGRIDAMFSDEEYFREIRSYHQGLLWGSLDQVNSLQAGGQRLSFNRAAGDMWFVGNNRRRYRGLTTVTCLDQPQNNYDAAGRPVPIATFSDPACSNVGAGPGTCVQEGYELVRPYWNPTIEIKVCAFDAMDVQTGINGSPCDSYNPDRGCGCGPNLQHCMRNNESGPLRAALEEEPVRIFEHVVRTDADYLEAFTTRTSFVSGPSAHYYNYQSGARTETLGGAVAYTTQMGAIPDLPYTDAETWRPVIRGPQHAGFTTTFGYLMRFASDRARANRFYTTFYCDPFVPKADGLPAEEENPNPNLRERSGCADCHQELEVAASHWGRWRTNSTYGYFGDFMSFGEPRADCLCGPGTGRANCSAYCNTYHVTAANSHPSTYESYGGLPLSRIYLSELEAAAIDSGPTALVDEPHEQELVASCTVRTLAEHLLNRPLMPNEFQWLEDQTAIFVADGRRFSNLYRTLLQDPKYRQIR